MIEISTYQPNMKQEWDEFVGRCCNATFLHRRDYMDYHSDRFTDWSLMARRGDKLIAVMPANAKGTTFYTHQGLTYGGWLHPLKHFDATVMMDLMDATCDWLRDNDFTTMVYKPVPHIYHQYPAEEDLYALFRNGAEISETNISTVVDLRNPLAFDRGNKSGVNVARKAGVVIAESDDWTGYWQVLDDVLQERFGAHPVHSLDEMELLHSRFPENIRLFTATIDGRIVAGVVMFLTDTVARTQYIASMEEGRENKALSLLFHTLIEKATAAGYRYFDFGTSNEEHGLVLNNGLVQQKARFGGRGIAFNTFKINL